jgi:hypothetical protein
VFKPWQAIISRGPVETLFIRIWLTRDRQNKYAEFYAPMYGGQLPKPVERSGRYASSYFKGTDSMIVNIKFGRLYEFEQELWKMTKLVRFASARSRSVKVCVSFRKCGISHA